MVQGKTRTAVEPGGETRHLLLRVLPPVQPGKCQHYLVGVREQIEARRPGRRNIAAGELYRRWGAQFAKGEVIVLGDQLLPTRHRAAENRIHLYMAGSWHENIGHEASCDAHCEPTIAHSP